MAEVPNPLLGTRARMLVQLTSPPGVPFRTYTVYGHEGESRRDLIQRSFLEVEAKFACEIVHDVPENYRA